MIQGRTPQRMGAKKKVYKMNLSLTVFSHLFKNKVKLKSENKNKNISEFTRLLNYFYKKSLKSNLLFLESPVFFLFF